MGIESSVPPFWMCLVDKSITVCEALEYCHDKSCKERNLALLEKNKYTAAAAAKKGHWFSVLPSWHIWPHILLFTHLLIFFFFYSTVLRFPDSLKLSVRAIESWGPSHFETSSACLLPLTEFPCSTLVWSMCYIVYCSLTHIISKVFLHNYWRRVVNQLAWAFELHRDWPPYGKAVYHLIEKYNPFSTWQWLGRWWAGPATCYANLNHLIVTLWSPHLLIVSTCLLPLVIARDYNCSGTDIFSACAYLAHLSGFWSITKAAKSYHNTKTTTKNAPVGFNRVTTVQQEPAVWATEQPWEKILIFVLFFLQVPANLAVTHFHQPFPSGTEAELLEKPVSIAYQDPVIIGTVQPLWSAWAQFFPHSPSVVALEENESGVTILHFIFPPHFSPAPYTAPAPWTR